MSRREPPLHERSEISASEAAALWGVSLRHVQRLCKSKDLPATKKLFKVWCIDLVALKERHPEEWERLATKHAAKISGKCIVCGR